VSHSDASLIEAVRRGRREEFESFAWRGEFPDPQSEATFARSKLHHERRREGRHNVLLRFYRELIRLRRGLPPLAELDREQMDVMTLEQENVLFARWVVGRPPRPAASPLAGLGGFSKGLGIGRPGGRPRPRGNAPPSPVQAQQLLWARQQAQQAVEA